MWGIECLLLIPFTLHLRKLQPGGKWIYFYLINSVFFAAGSILVALIMKHNLWFYNIMYFIQFVVASSFFHAIIKSKTAKLVIALMILPVLTLVLLDYFHLEGPYAYNSYATSAETLILMVYAVLFFWQLLRDEELVQKSVFINSLPDFWYNAGLFVYHCSYFLFTLANNFAQFSTKATQNASHVSLGITFVAGAIQLILFYIGLLKAKKIRP